MTGTLRKETLIRLAWIAELRRQGHRQCHDGRYNNGRLVCALGLLREVALPDWRYAEREAVDEIEEVGALAGLTAAESLEITLRNDGDIIPETEGEGEYHKHTFAEIADVVAGWFSNTPSNS